MRILYIAVVASCLGACTIAQEDNSVVTAQPYIGLQERTHRSELRELLDVDPVRTEWCAAFVNSVLEIDGIPNLNDQSKYPPLMARSFLRWGKAVDIPSAGDIVIFPRGDSDWKGHVGFYLNTVEKNNKVYYSILGGNQNDKVSIALYSAKKALGIRRANKY